MSASRDLKLVVLDRDGTINRDSANYIKSAAEWKALPHSLEAIAQLCHAGWTVCVASNQSGIGRGLFTIVDLHEIHAKMQSEIESFGGHIAGFYFCPHTPDDDCDCRKPKPGLLHEIAARFGVDMTDVPVIGDSERDLQAAEAVGARPILVRTGNGRRELREHYKDGEVEVYGDLAAAVSALLAEE
ncbi:MAG: D-glycero-beta-D-manno-heptose 1,7-bisphosphate 7-phosphatase [Gammaproteobacteria bacterium]|nr:D-glycero-beta-D-manno-heptose 1,7-bisphosphate 7-phosphatase [Gammaproteobacteria bacterium]